MMPRLSKYIRQQMARALVKHRFNDRADELMSESSALFNAVLDERYDAGTRKLMAQLGRRHPGAFGRENSLYLRANGMRVSIGASAIGSFEAARWTPEIAKRPVLEKSDGEPSKELADRIAAFALQTKAFTEEVETAYRRALGALEQFGTAKRLTEEWPEALPVIGHLIPSEDRALPTVQVQAINNEFGLPPAELEAA